MVQVYPLNHREDLRLLKSLRKEWNMKSSNWAIILSPMLHFGSCRSTTSHTISLIHWWLLFFYSIHHGSQWQEAQLPRPRYKIQVWSGYLTFQILEVEWKRLLYLWLQHFQKCIYHDIGIFEKSLFVSYKSTQNYFFFVWEGGGFVQLLLILFRVKNSFFKTPDILFI